MCCETVVSRFRAGCSGVPKRYELCFMCFLGVTILITMRTTLSLCIFNLSPHLDRCISTTNITTAVASNACPDGVPFTTISKAIEFMLISFYLGYGMTEAASVYLLRRAGAKHLLAASVFISSLVLTASSLATCSSGYNVLLVSFALGLAGGPMFPSVNELLSEWTPSNERTFLATFVFAGFQVGLISSLTAVNYLIRRVSWSYLYSCLSCVGVAWSVLWSMLFYSSPAQHPHISRQELKYMRDKVPPTHKDMDIPWRDLVSSKPLWSLGIALTGCQFACFTIEASIPYFYSHYTRLSHIQNGNYSSIPIIVDWLMMALLGYVSNKLLVIGWTSETTLRKTLAAMGVTVVGLGMVSASYTRSTESLLSCIFLSVSFIGVFYPALKVNTLDLSPTHAGLVIALTTTPGKLITGISYNFLKSIVNNKDEDWTACYIVTEERRSQWQLFFWILFALLHVSIVPFLIFGSGNVQPWNKPSESTSSRPQHGYRLQT